MHTVTLLVQSTSTTATLAFTTAAVVVAVAAAVVAVCTAYVESAACSVTL
jgi:hypothetical protein